MSEARIFATILAGLAACVLVPIAVANVVGTRTGRFPAGDWDGWAPCWFVDREWGAALDVLGLPPDAHDEVGVQRAQARIDSVEAFGRTLGTRRDRCIYQHWVNYSRWRLARYEERIAERRQDEVVAQTIPRFTSANDGGIARTR